MCYLSKFEYIAHYMKTKNKDPYIVLDTHKNQQILVLGLTKYLKPKRCK